MSQTPPPGWYPDPQDQTRQRYWDGTRWTEHTAAGEGTSGQVAAAAAQASATQGASVNTWTWQSIVVTILCCGGIFSLPGILNAGRAEGAQRAGDLAAAREFASRARTWTLIGLGVGVLGAIAVLAIFGAAFAGVGSILGDGCAEAEPGTAQYDFCVGLCLEADPTGTPFEFTCEGF